MVWAIWLTDVVDSFAWLRTDGVPFTLRFLACLFCSLPRFHLALDGGLVLLCLAILVSILLFVSSSRPPRCGLDRDLNLSCSIHVFYPVTAK